MLLLVGAFFSEEDYTELLFIKVQFQRPLWVWRGPSTRSLRMWVWWKCVLLCMSQMKTLSVPSHSHLMSVCQLEITVQVLDIAVLYVYMMSTILHSTVDPMDYLGVSTILMFEACQRRSCVTVTIVDDEVLENVESFNVTLERTPGLDMRITLDPVDGVVEITDDDGLLIF